MFKKYFAAAGAGLAIAAMGAVPAFAGGTPGGSGTVEVTGNIAQSCGFTGSDLGGLDMGQITPGATAGPVSLTYTVQCNDAAGYQISVVDAGAKITQNGTNVTIPSSNWQAIGTETGGNPASPWTSSGSTPFTLDSGSSNTPPAGTAFTDKWFLAVPSNLYYPGALTDTITYQVFAQ